MQVSDMVKSYWVFRQLRNIRAGIEGRISAIESVFDLGLRTWRGKENFDAYGWTSIIAYNLVGLSRHCKDKRLP